VTENPVYKGPPTPPNPCPCPTHTCLNAQSPLHGFGSARSPTPPNMLTFVPPCALFFFSDAFFYQFKEVFDFPPHLSFDLPFESLRQGS